jgi:hypothetical protein
MVNGELLVCTYMFVWCRGIGVDVLFLEILLCRGCVLAYCIAWQVYNIVPADCKAFFFSPVVSVIRIDVCYTVTYIAFAVH